MGIRRISLPTLLALVKPTFYELLNSFLVDSSADPLATSIHALCHVGMPSGWSIVRGSSLRGRSARIQSASTLGNISKTLFLRLNYSSFDFAAFVYHFYDENEIISISLSSDEFANQSLPIGAIGTCVTVKVSGFCIL